MRKENGVKRRETIEKKKEKKKKKEDDQQAFHRDSEKALLGFIILYLLRFPLPMSSTET